MEGESLVAKSNLSGGYSHLLPPLSPFLRRPTYLFILSMGENFLSCDDDMREFPMDRFMVLVSSSSLLRHLRTHVRKVSETSLLSSFFPNVQ